MPIVEFSVRDLERLVGRKFEEFEPVLRSKVKGEVEAVEEGVVRMEVTSDRPDHFSAEGLARTIKGLLEVELGIPKLELVHSGVEVVADRIEERPYIFSCIVYDLELDEYAISQMIQLQEKLAQTYGRDRRVFAIGFYDLDKIRPPIYYRRASPSTRYRPLGEEKEMTISEVFEKTEKGVKYSRIIRRDEPPVLVDSEGTILTTIPVLGSEDTKVTPSTRNVLIDVTATDERRGLDALAVLTYSLAERSRSRRVGYVEVTGAYRNITPVLERRRFKVDEKLASSIIGVEISRGEFERYVLMSRLELEGDYVVAPAYRISMLHPVDVVEDVAIVMGYDSLPPSPPSQIAPGRLHKVTRRIRLVRTIMLSMGFQEVFNYTLSSREVMVDRIGWPRVLPTILNPVSEKFNVVRDYIFPQLIEVASENYRLIGGEIKIFEVGEVSKGVKTKYTVAFLISREGVTLTDGVVVLNTLLRALALSPMYKPCEVPPLISGRTACVVVNDKEVGLVGEVRPEVLLNFGLLQPTLIGEVEISW